MPKVAYYPGNVARAGASEIEDCIQPLCKALNIQLVELPRASSDGGNVIKQATPKLQDALVARNLALAEAKGLDVMTTCATSHAIMCNTALDMQRDPVYASTVNNLVARTSKVEYGGESQSWHLVHYLVEEIGLDKVRDAVKNPLKMNIAAYYGPTCNGKVHALETIRSCPRTWSNSSKRWEAHPSITNPSATASVQPRCSRSKTPLSP